MPSSAFVSLAARHDMAEGADNPYAPTDEQMAALPEPWAQQVKYAKREQKDLAPRFQEDDTDRFTFDGLDREQGSAI